MGRSSIEESDHSSSSSSSSDSNAEEEKVVITDTDRISMPGTSETVALPSQESEEDAGVGYGDPESPSSKADSSSSEGVLVEHPANADQESRLLPGDRDSGIFVNIDGSMQENLEGDDDNGSHRGDDVGREEQFVDAPDQLGFVEGRSGGGLEESMAMIDIGENTREKQLVDEVAKVNARLDEALAECRKYKEEQELFGKEIGNLQCELKAMIGRQSLIAVRESKGTLEHLHRDEIGTEGMVDKDMMASIPLQSQLSDCSKLASHLRASLDEQMQSEGTIRELHAILYTKDQEIENLNMKLSESSVSRDVIYSYFNSIRDEQVESLRESTAAAARRLLVSLASVIQDDEGPEDSFLDEISLVEKKTLSLIEKFAWFQYEIEHLGHCLAAASSDFIMPQGKEFGLVFDAARKEVLEIRTKESYFLEKINGLELEKREVLEQLDRMKERLEEATSEASKTKMELEQAEHRFLAAKEKLGIAVTKGKSLVQHRDSLKQSLAEKTLELEKCLQELQMKSDALKAATENAKELQQSQDLVFSLQNLISEREKVLLEIEEAMSQTDGPEELQSLDSTGRIRWLVDLRNVSEGALVEKRKLQDALSSFDLPGTVSTATLEYQINWLGESFAQSKEDVIKLQDELVNARAASESRESQLLEMHKEIEHLTESLLLEKHEKDTLQVVHVDLISKYEGMGEELSRLSSENNGLMRALREVSGCVVDDEIFEEMDVFVEKCTSKIRERMEASSEPSFVLTESFQRLQSLLYVRNQELILFEKMLEEEMIDRAETVSLKDKLCRATEDVAALRTERDLLRNELERLEEKSSLIREKLSMAVKKGKGLVQEREGFKHSLDEKNSEIEKLKHELKLQESAVIECKEQIKALTADLEHFQKLESDIILIKDERDQIERFLLESNANLQKVIESIEQIVLPSDITFESPVERVNQIAQHIHESEAGKVYAEQELEKSKEEVVLQANKLVDAHATIKSLKDALSRAEDRISVILEEREEVQLVKASREQELEKAKEEADMQAARLQKAYKSVKSLEDALSEAENRISLLTEERNELESKSKQEIEMLNARIATCMKELAGTHGSLENQSADLVSHLSHLLSLTRDEGLISLITEGFKKNIGGLKAVVDLIHDIHGQFSAEGPQTLTGFQQGSALAKLISLPQFEDYIRDTSLSSSPSTEESADDMLSFTRVAEGISVQNKLLGDRFALLSRYTDDYVALLMQALQTTREEVIHAVELRESYKLNVHKLEASNKAQEVEISTLQDDLRILHSACSDALQVLQQINFHDILDVGCITEQNLIFNIDLESSEAYGGGPGGSGIREHVSVAEKLVLASKRIKVQVEQCSKVKNIWTEASEDLKNKLKEAEATVESAIQDKALGYEKVAKLEEDLKSLENFCSDLKSKIEDYQAKESMWKDKETELVSLQSQLVVKDRDKDKLLVLESQLEALFDKVDKMELPLKELEVEAQELHFSSTIEKISYILDDVGTLQNMMNLLAREKDSLESSLAVHIDEIDRLKKEAERLASITQELENKKYDLSELSMRLERIIQKLGGSDLLEDKRPLDAKGLLLVLEKLIIASGQESESSRSRAQELGAKLLASQKVVDELSMKVKLLEDSVHSRSTLPETTERNIFEPSSSVPGSEISEIEDVAPLGKNSVSSVTAAAAQLRAMRKGSTDHLAINIDTESDRLISSYETDDKGHVFKSLNTSGLIPMQGKLIADRIDSIWVSGGRILMGRPGARMGLIAYWLLLHMWVLGTIL